MQYVKDYISSHILNSTFPYAVLILIILAWIESDFVYCKWGAEESHAAQSGEWFPNLRFKRHSLALQKAGVGRSLWWGHLPASSPCTAWRRGQGRAGAHAERWRLSCVWLSNEHPSASVAFSEPTEKKLASCSYLFLCTALGGGAGVDRVLAAKIILCLKFGNCLNTYTLSLW